MGKNKVKTMNKGNVMIKGEIQVYSRKKGKKLGGDVVKASFMWTFISQG